MRNNFRHFRHFFVDRIIIVRILSSMKYVFHDVSLKRRRKIMAGKFQILSEFYQFMKERKKWWLGPIVIMLLMLGLLIILTEGSAVAPFVYALF